LLQEREGIPVSIQRLIEAPHRFRVWLQTGYYTYPVENDCEKDRCLSNLPLSLLTFADIARLTQCDLPRTKKQFLSGVVVPSGCSRPARNRQHLQPAVGEKPAELKTTKPSAISDRRGF
jgi:hypothetical protein